MAGQILKRKRGGWLVRIYLGRDPETGKRTYINRHKKGTKKEATDFLTELLHRHNTGTLVETPAITLNQYLDDWIKAAASTRVRSRTLQIYKYLLDRYVRPELGKLQLSQVTPLAIQTLYGNLLDRDVAKGKDPRKLSARTVRHTHGVLRSALNQAVKWRMLYNNPALFVDLPRCRKVEMKVLTPEQAAKFLEIASKDELGPLFALALSTGMRPGEYLGLRWKDVDLQRGIVVVTRTVSFDKGGGHHFGEPKTPQSARTIPLPKTVTKLLIEHKIQQAKRKLEIRKKCAEGKRKTNYDDLDLVFAGDNGHPIHYRNVTNRHLKPLFREAGLPQELRLYDLRHSCATLLLAEGEHPKVVSERLGHSTITLTLDTYSHVLPTMQQAAAEKLEAVLFKAPQAS